MLLRTLPTNPTDASIPPISLAPDIDAYILSLSPRGWYDASNSAYRVDASGKCAQLTDRSGNGFHLLQATGANQPPVSANYWGSLNGVNRDALAFDGTTNLTMETAGNLFDGTTVWTVFAVYRPVAGTNLALFGSTSGSGAGGFTEFLLSSTNSVFPGGGSGVQIALPTQYAKIIGVATYNYPGSGNVAVTHDLNNVSGSASIALGVTSPGTGHFLIGALGDHTFKFNGLLSEVMLFKSVLTAPQIAALKNYAAQKYA